jgi:ABC-2 type transport system permease protein
MPDWMQRVSDVSPVKWAILALEGAIWRGFGAAEMALPVGVLLAIGGVSLVLGLKLFRVSQQGS